MPRYSLSWITSDGKSQSFIGDQDTVTIGRGVTADVRIDDPTVSSLHARLTRQGDKFQIEDLASRNGVKVNSHPIRSATSLANGDRIEFGGVRATFNLEGAVPARANPPTQVQRTAPPPAKTSAPPVPAAVVPAPPVPVSSPPGDGSSWYVCPVCRNSNTGKLTAIAKSGAWSSAGAALSVGGIHTARGTIPTTQVSASRGLSATFMAQIAAPPAPPDYRTPMGGIIVAVTGLFFALLGFAMIDSKGGRPNYGFGFVFFILAAAMIAFGIYHHKKEQEAARAAYESAHSFWQRAIAAHDRLFYCDRCDTVFDASTRAHRPADLAFQLLG